MCRIFKKLILLFALLIVSAVCSFATQGDGTLIISYDKLTGTQYDTLVVAKVGNITITAKEFLLSYEYGPAFIKKGSDSRQRYLDFMIDEKLLTLDAYARHLEKADIVKATLAEIEGDLATEELYKEDVLSRVVVSEQEVSRSAEREKEHVTLKWLYAPTFDDIHQYQKQLRAGVAFDSLFTRQLCDSVALEDRSMETTRFKLETKNATLSAVVDTLKVGAASASIGTTDGWYIVKISNVWKNAIITESEENKIRTNVSRALFQRKADVLSDRYVQQLMRDHDPVIKRRTFDLLRAYLGKRIFPPEKYLKWNLTKKLMAEFGPIDSVKIEDHLDDPLVKLTDGEIVLRDFMIWYQTRQPNIRFSKKTPQSFFVSLEQFIWRMVRDKLLVATAKKRNFQNRDIVKIQKQWWLDKSVYSVAKSTLGQSIHLTEEDVHNYYDKNKIHYRQGNGIEPSWEEIKADVTKDAYQDEFSKKLLHKILALRKKYKIEINQTVLGMLPIDMENRPDAIDVYVVKKGGTFPRPAFPTIDYDWRTWY